MADELKIEIETSTPAKHLINFHKNSKNKILIISLGGVKQKFDILSLLGYLSSNLVDLLNPKKPTTNQMIKFNFSCVDLKIELICNSKRFLLLENYFRTNLMSFQDGGLIGTGNHE